MVGVGGEQLDGEVPHHRLDVQLARPLPLAPALVPGHLLPGPGGGARHELEVEVVGHAADGGREGGGQLERDGQDEVGVGEPDTDLMMFAVGYYFVLLIILHFVVSMDLFFHT